LLKFVAATASALEAAAGLVQMAITTCQYEAAEIATVPPGRPHSPAGLRAGGPVDAGERATVDRRPI